jgi:saccharopine dehydrogenase-like NADP-dependent oxidoreductase
VRKVLVIGGTGFFGGLLIDDLLTYVDCDLVVASRRPIHSDRFKTVVADLSERDSLERALDDVRVAICAAGPYQRLPLVLVELCLQGRIHYIDLADDRGFVGRVRSMVAGHEDTRSAVCTGWSTVPALSGLLVAMASAGLPAVESIHIHMAPGNRGARQLATIAALMHSVGQPFTVFREGKWHRVLGWSEPRDFIFPSPIGKRRGYLVDVPDHDIFPNLFGARTVEFRAGSELRALNVSLALLRQSRRNWVSWSGCLQRAAASLSWIGHDFGAIGVEVSGGRKRTACIVADRRAERIAVMPAAVMTRELLSGVQHSGLISYMDWLTSEQLQSECDRRGFRLIVEEN